MNWKMFDALRRQSSPLEVNLFEAYAANRISRRDFVRRGTILGVGTPVMAAVIAACGGSSDGGDSAATTTNDNDSSSNDSSNDSEPAAAEPTEAPAPVAGGEILAGIQFGDANSGLDPINMLDLGTYATVSQSLEYLVGLGADGNIGATGLATGWSPNGDGTAWTFNLREGVTWHDGSPLTSDQVAATIDRMVVAGAGLAGIVSEGAVETPDDLTAVVNLDKANGNLPVLLSIFNPQSLITPVDFDDGTTLDARPVGTGPWMLESFDATTFESVWVANDNYWGGRPILDKVTLLGFAEEGSKIAAMQARELDMVQDFGAVAGSGLLSDTDFQVLAPPSSNHRQLWFNTQLPEEGPFTDPRVRQAIGYCLDRQQMVDLLFNGRAIVGNDHPVHPTLPFFDSGLAQRPRDIEKAKQLLADAGYSDLTATLQAGDILASPDMAAIVEQNCAEAGITLSVNVTPNSDFYGEHWCTGASWGAQPETAGPGRPCGASHEIGIVDYGHRPVPDIFLTRALQTDGDWNSSNYANADYDALVTQYQGAVDVEGQKAAITQIQALVQEDSPALYSFFYDYLSGHDKSVQGVQVTALGHMKFEKASKTA